jgi:short subunit dehydrogenase-like uncharacterized protein
VPRIVLFGATGYTGGLTVDALAASAVAVDVVVAGRSAARLAAPAERLGADVLEVDAADAERVLAGALAPGDVLVTTVGPFVRYGIGPLRAAVASGAHYVDATGEPPFVRRVFEEAAGAGGCVLTAGGYDYVPGNLAGALALEEAGPDARRLEVGYFLTGGGRMSSGTTASAAGMLLEASHAHRDGALRTERLGRTTVAFATSRGTRQAMSLGGTEALSLPRLYPHVTDVVTHLGWLGPATAAGARAAGVLAALSRAPGVGSGLRAALGQLSRRTGQGPDEEARSGSGSHVVARALDGGGTVLAQVELTGVDGYTYTGNMLAWQAVELATAGPDATGAVGPVEAFGLRRLEAGVAAAGLTRA